MRKFAYRPDIDGLRAISVIGVVMFHADLGFPGGYVGVDVFFVISGFLITSLLLDEMNAGKFTFSSFLMRRIRRILPASVVMTATTLLAGYFLLTPVSYSQLASSAIAQTLMSSNIFFWRDVGYFAESADLKPLLHTWSLSIEEQFYIFFPLALAVIHRFKRGWLPAAVLITLTLSCSLNLIGVHIKPGATFFLLPTRAWELLSGCLVALIPASQSPRRFFDEACGIFGLAAIILPMLFYTKATLFPGLAATLPVLGAVLVIAANRNKQTISGIALSCRPLVFCGLISYSVYLWHWPILAFARHVSVDLGAGTRIVLALSSVLLGILSWRYIELPFRNSSILKLRPITYSFAILSALFLSIISIAIIATGGVKNRFSSSIQQYVEDVDWTGSEYATSTPTPIGYRLASSITPMRDFVVWGDSHALAAADLINNSAIKNELSGTAFLAQGNIPIPNLWTEADSAEEIKTRTQEVDSVFDYIVKNRIRDVILIARWSAMCDGYNRTESEQFPERKRFAPLVKDQKQKATPQSATEALARQLQWMISDFTNRGIRVWLVKQIPESDDCFTAKRFLIHKQFPSFNLPAPRSKVTLADHENRQRRIESVFANVNSPLLHYLDPSASFFSDNHYLSLYSERAIYRDDDHLTKYGADYRLKKLANDLFERIRELKVSK
jgi:peptidoglycan/LPS O-acetylase OafA/YrhL